MTLNTQVSVLMTKIWIEDTIAYNQLSNHQKILILFRFWWCKHHKPLSSECENRSSDLKLRWSLNENQWRQLLTHCHVWNLKKYSIFFKKIYIYLMRTSGFCNISNVKERICSPCGCNIEFSWTPSWIFQLVSNGFWSCYFNVQWTCNDEKARFSVVFFHIPILLMHTVANQMQ